MAWQQVGCSGNVKWDHSGFGFGQWEKMFHSNGCSHWLSSWPELSLVICTVSALWKTEWNWFKAVHNCGQPTKLNCLWYPWYPWSLGMWCSVGMLSHWPRVMLKKDIGDPLYHGYKHGLVSCCLWRPSFIMMPNLSSLVAPVLPVMTKVGIWKPMPTWTFGSTRHCHNEVVIVTTSSATSIDKVGIMTVLGFQSQC